MLSSGLAVCNAAETGEPGVNVSIERLASIEQLLIRGQKMMDAGELDVASELFDQVLSKQPDQSTALYQKGVILIRKSDYPGGIGLIERAVESEPENLVYKSALARMYEFTGRMNDALLVNKDIMVLAEADSSDYKQAQRNSGFIEATMLASQGDLQQAEGKFKELSVIFPEDFMIRYSLGIALMLEGKTDQAQSSLEKARDMNPGYANTYLSLATLYEKTGHLDKAYEMLAALVAMDVTSEVEKRARSRMYVIEGRLLLAEGNASDALGVFSNARKLDSENKDILFTLGVLYEQMSDWAGVIDVSEKFLQLAGNQADVMLRLAKAYVNVGKFFKAAVVLKNLIDFAPESTQAKTARMQLNKLMASSVGALIIADEREQQILELQKVVIDHPDDLEALRLLITLQMQQERWQDARVALEKLLAIEPSAGLTHTSLALVYDKLGLYDLAIKPYVYGVSLEPDPDSAARIAMSLLMVTAKALYASGDLGSAKRLFDELQLMQPANYEVRFYIGLIFFNQDQIVDAIDAFQRVLQYAPGHVGARLNLAWSYHRLKREEDAIDEFRNALQFNPTGPLADNIMEQMLSVEKSIRGFSGGLSYVLAYDNNSNLDDADEVPEYRTDFSPQLIYRYKAGNGLRWRLSSAPVYSSYHNGQYDFLNTSSTISASVSKGRVTMGSGVNYQVSRGLVNSQRSSNSTTYYGEWLGLFKLPVILRPWRSERALTNTSVNASYTRLDSLGSSFYSAFKYSAVVSFSQPVAERTVLGLNYRAILSENMYAIGTDYAYRGKGLDIQLERGLAAGISVNGSYSLTRLSYLYPDSVSGYSSYRNNLLQALTVGVGYQFHQSLRFFANINRAWNYSNLPTGYILNAQDVIEGLQSPSLGDYSRFTFTAGVALSL
jgi:tetratricopeptide (TPR) repeat protein